MCRCYYIFRLLTFQKLQRIDLSVVVKDFIFRMGWFLPCANIENRPIRKPIFVFFNFIKVNLIL